MTTAADSGLARFVADWKPEPVVEHDDLAPLKSTRLASTLNFDESFAAGDAVPVPWHWIYFPDWPAGSALGADGHPRDGHFLPPIPNRRRMFAGSRIEVSNPLRLGVATTKTSSLAKVAEKTGRTGEMLFVTIRSEYHQNDALCVVEEQNLVYRSETGASRPFARNTEALGESSAEWSLEPAVDEALLFRFSALTSNAHRIHYDHPYTTSVEGYPGLVVHGPLLAVYMAHLARANGKPLSQFEFRLQAPVILGDAFRAEGSVAGRRRVAVGGLRRRPRQCQRDGRARVTSREVVASARSLLFVPGNRPERFAKAVGTGADVVIVDLEDAVGPGDKDAARNHVADWLAAGNVAMVRINAFGTPWHDADVELVQRFGVPAMLAKAETAEQVARVGVPVVPLVETAVGVLNAAAVSAASGVVRTAFGSIDLATELGVSPEDRDALLLRALVAGVRRRRSADRCPDRRGDDGIEGPRRARLRCALCRAVGADGQAVHPSGAGIAGARVAGALGRGPRLGAAGTGRGRAGRVGNIVGRQDDRHAGDRAARVGWWRRRCSSSEVIPHGVGLMSHSAVPIDGMPVD